MGIVRPSVAVEQRWSGALQASLRQAPLEIFLRSRALSVARTGPARHSDNVARGTVYLLQTGVQSYCSSTEEGLDAGHYPLIGHAACLVSRTLAHVIAQPTCWRIAALVSVAQLLSPWMGLTQAAFTSASSLREFCALPAGDSISDRLLCSVAKSAIVFNDEEAVADLSTQFAARLALAAPAAAQFCLTLPQQMAQR